MTVFWDYLPWVAPCQCTFDLLVALVGLGYPGGSDGKESDCNAGDSRSVTGLGRSPGEGNGHSSILTWRIPRTEEPGRLKSMGLQSQTRLSY